MRGDGNEMSKLEVFFDYVAIGSDIEVGVAIVEDDEVVGSKLKTYENAKVLTNGNNYHFTLTAWRDAVKYLITYVIQEGLETDLEQVTFCNQNHLIFKWASSGKCDETYARILAQVMDATTSLNDLTSNLRYAFKKVASKNNRVKKLLKKRKELKGEQEEEFTFAPIQPREEKREASRGSKKGNGFGGGTLRASEMSGDTGSAWDNVVDMNTYSYERKLKEG